VLRVSKCFGLSLVIVLLFAPRGVRAASDRAPDPFPNVVLTTHEGRTVRFYDDLIEGKIVAINLIYTRCRYACPLETAKLAQVHRLLGDRMGRDVFFYSITIDPEHDTPAVLKEYAQRFREGPGWLFLTGARADIELIGTKLGLYSTTSRSNSDGHMPYLLVGNAATGQWMRNSALDRPQFIARTIGDWLSNWQFSKGQALRSHVEAPRVKFTRGEYTFASRCAACHTIGRGAGIGPDLHGVTAVRDRSWLFRMIREPDKLLSEGDPAVLALSAKYKQVRMPNLDISEAEAAALIDYIDERSRMTPPNSAAQTTAARTQTWGHANLKSVVGAYLRIHRALYANSLRGVTAQARLIMADCAMAHAADDPICSAAAALVRGSDLQAARTAFDHMGVAIMKAAKDQNVPLGPGIRVAYCPMLRKYWLQAGEQVRNPFYGTGMRDCGHLVPQIPDVLQ
jgi:protein SCO1/2